METPLSLHLGVARLSLRDLAFALSCGSIPLLQPSFALRILQSKTAFSHTATPSPNLSHSCFLSLSLCVSLFLSLCPWKTEAIPVTSFPWHAGAARVKAPCLPCWTQLCSGRRFGPGHGAQHWGWLLHCPTDPLAGDTSNMSSAARPSLCVTNIARIQLYSKLMSEEHKTSSFFAYWTRMSEIVDLYHNWNVCKHEECNYWPENEQLCS